MVLIWNDAKSFQRHLEDMKEFRQSHDGIRNEEITLFQDMPATYDIDSPGHAGGCRHVIRHSSKTIIVPIWKITLPGNIQN